MKLLLSAIILFFPTISLSIDIHIENVSHISASKLISRLADVKISYLGKEKPSKITLVGRNMTKHQLLESYSDSLNGLNLSMINKNGAFQIVNGFKVTKYNPPVVDNLDGVIGVVSYVFKVDRKLIDEIHTTITPMIGTGAKVSKLSSINSIMITDRGSNISTILDVIDKLIAIDNADQTITKKIQIDFSDVKTISAKINDLKIPGLKILSDSNNRQLFLIGKSEAVEKASVIVGGMNVSKKRISIEVLIAEISENDNLAKGMQFALGKKYGIGVTSWGGEMASLTDLLSGDFNNLGDGGTLAFGKGIDFGIIAQAIKQTGHSSILSTPIINTIDGIEANFIVGKNVPFVTKTETSDSSNPFSTIVREDVGLKLKVTPRVLSTGQILLDVEQEISSISESAVAKDIITNKRFLKTEIISASNELVVLGGLIDKTSNNKTSKVPLLGDIPYFGKAFSHDKEDGGRRKLLIFMKPSIITDSIKNINNTIKNQKDFFAGSEVYPFLNINDSK